MSLNRFQQAWELGPMALLRLRAEVLLDHPYPLSEADRGQLERIAVEPREGDREWLNQFDFIFEKDEGRDQ